MNTLLLPLLTIFFLDQVITQVHEFHPPSLDIDNAYINIRSNGTLRIVCIGKYPLAWETPVTGFLTNGSRLSILPSVNNSDNLNKYESTLILEDLEFNDTGYYVCYYEGSNDTSSPENSTSIYVFVNDPFHLFVETPASIMGRLFIPVQQHRTAVLQCLPTSSGLNITLWKTEGEEEMVSMGNDVEFDPRRGFIIHYPTIFFHGLFQCRAHSFGGIEDAIDLTLFYMADTYNAPQPYINTSEALHPVVNETFVLKCTVDVDPDTRLFIDWSYPNKNKSEGRINETQPISQWKTTRSYKHQEVSTSLIVRGARSSDSGRYICTVTDHSQKTGRADVNINVYDTPQPSHVNLTTDIDTSQPVVAEAGENVRFVVTVTAYPHSSKQVELSWWKGGKRLREDNHYHMNRTNSTTVLEIKQLTRADADTYVLHGRTKDANNSLAILLEVKGKKL